MDSDITSTLSIVGLIAFVAFWCSAGWLAGRFFGLVNSARQTNEWHGRWPVETDRMITLAALAVLVVLAGTVDAQLIIPQSIKIGAFAASLLCLVAAYRMAVSSGSRRR